MSENPAVKKKENKHKHIIVFAFCTVLALCICMVSVLCVAFALVTEGTYETGETKEIQSLTKRPETEEDILKYVASLTNSKTDPALVKIDSSVNVSVNDVACSSDTSTSLVNYLKDDVVSYIDSVYPENETGLFGKETDDIPEIILTKKDILKAECTEGTTDDEGNIIDENYYFSSIFVNPVNLFYSTENNVSKTFGLYELKDVAETVKNEFKDICTIKNCETENGDFIITAKTARENDRISYISFERNYKITLHAEFTGKLKEFNEDVITFNYKVIKKYDYEYAGISFTNDTLTIEPSSNSISVSVNAVMNNDEEYKVSFKSADESIVTVDELGYLTGVKESNKPVKITVTLEYLGNTFTDECTVYVRTPVEKIKISESEITLKTGETTSLSASLKPKNATDKKILWFVEGDDGIITVDENGNVTAKSEGTAKAVAVSDDGFFRDSCEITVKGGEVK